MTPPAIEDAAAFAPLFLAALEAGDIACVELRLDTGAEAEWRRAIDALRPLAQDRGIAFLLHDRPALAAETGCDGVRIARVDDYGAARAALGAQAIVGVATGDSRHDAMVAGERGADFVSLAPDPELVEWWTEVMEIPCVAALPGADFREIGAEAWEHPDGPAAAIRALAP